MGHAGDLRGNAPIVLGLVYIVAFATLAVRLERKPHFEEVFGNAGLVFLLGALVSGVLDSSRPWGVVARCASRDGDSGHVGLVPPRALARTSPRAFLAAYIGSVRFCLRHSASRERVAVLVAALLGIGALTLIFTAHRRMSER